MSALDLIIVLIVLTSLLTGYKKGLILTLFSTGSLLAAFILTKLYHRAAAGWIISNTAIEEGIQNIVSKNISDAGQWITSEGAYGTDSLTKLFNWANHYFSVGNMQINAMDAVGVVKEDIAVRAAHLMISLISAAALFIVIRISLALLGSFLNSVFTLPALDTINRMAGLVIGGVKGALIAVLLLILMLPVALAEPEGWIASLINSSQLIKFFLDHASTYLQEWVI